MEGRFLGLPAVAMSLVTEAHKGRHYESAARAAVEIIARLRAPDPERAHQAQDLLNRRVHNRHGFAQGRVEPALPLAARGRALQRQERALFRRGLHRPGGRRQIRGLFRLSEPQHSLSPFPRGAATAKPPPPAESTAVTKYRMSSIAWSFSLTGASRALPSSHR